MGKYMIINKYRFVYMISKHQYRMFSFLDKSNMDREKEKTVFKDEMEVFVDGIHKIFTRNHYTTKTKNMPVKRKTKFFLLANLMFYSIRNIVKCSRQGKIHTQSITSKTKSKLPQQSSKRE